MGIIDWKIEPAPGGRGTLYLASHGGVPWSVREVLDLLRTSPEFRNELTATIARSPYVSFRWEMPPLTSGKLGRAFEFVLVDDPHLNGMQPEPEVFASWFDDALPDTCVLAVPNLGRTALLVVPRRLADAPVYGHIGAFLRNAPRDQVHALWSCAARTAADAISDAPLWVSTAGAGVAWLHVRIERTPKYYRHGPYATEP
jgi:hypothetical protein